MNSKSLTILLFVSVCLIWGTTWFAMEVALHSIPPIFATALRFLLAAPLLAVLAKVFNQPLLFPKGKRQWLLIVALMYFAIPFTLMIYGEQYISSGLASIIFANMPVAVMLMSGLFLGLRLAKHQIFGLVTAVVSLCLILGNEMQMGGDDYLVGTICLGLAVAIHAVMYVLVQKHCKGIEVLTYNAVPSLIASLFLFAVSAMGESVNVESFTWDSISAVVYLGFVASVGGIVAYFKLGQVSTPFQASICFLIFPVVALLISCYINGEVLSEQSLLMMLPLLCGILLTKAPKGIFKLRGGLKTVRS
ncbi:EamA family transporter [Vibrio splendidus]|uniref:DMT family transporter n=1 Tax=Vibrio lentus TaxID=136468 RepID=A0A4U2BAF7_9VIBR|nr:MULTISPECIES: DMT family transporter [Vibrio]PHN86277.1 EamA family transporter [Vibrio splendidus]PMG54718.1 multidrug DMT transporter permease [Vibrio splendidus]PML11485.1 multidrug DMT transporter permease [Vibrio lentus]TKF57261.1 DMT family transporter [Vibrio lentus]TKG10749.1 DMT family transporter [Vibrio lentus]